MTTSLFDDIDAAMVDFHAFYEDEGVGLDGDLACGALQKGKERFNGAAVADATSERQRGSRRALRSHESADVEDLLSVRDTILDWAQYTGLDDDQGTDRHWRKEDGIPRPDSATLFSAVDENESEVRSLRESMVHRRDMPLDYFELDCWGSQVIKEERSEQPLAYTREKRVSNARPEWSASMYSASTYSTGTTVSLQSGSITEPFQRRTSSRAIASPTATALSRISRSLNQHEAPCTATHSAIPNPGLAHGFSLPTSPVVRTNLVCPKISCSVTEPAASLPNYTLFPKTTPLPDLPIRARIGPPATAKIQPKKIRTKAPKLKKFPSDGGSNKPTTPKVTPKAGILPSLRGGGPAHHLIGANKHLLDDDKSSDHHRREAAEATGLRYINLLDAENYAANVHVSEFVDPETASTYVPESSWDMTGASVLSRDAVTRAGSQRGGDKRALRYKKVDEVEQMRQEIQHDFLSKLRRVNTLKNLELEKIMRDENLTGEEKRVRCAELEETNIKRILEAKREAGYQVRRDCSGVR